MQRVRGMLRRFHFPWRNASEISREIDDELEFHLILCAEAFERDGFSPETARREALRRFGDLKGTRRQLVEDARRGERQTRRLRMLDDLGRDVRHAWRSLSRSPGFTVVAVLVLALGIGAASAAFSLVNMLLIRPALIENPDAIVGVYSENTERPSDFRGFSYPEYRELRERNGVFSELVAHTIDIVGVADGDVTHRSMVGFVSANYFEALGVPPARGRDFDSAEEAVAGNAAVAVVNHDYWVRGGRDPRLVGSLIRVNGQPVTVIGIAAEGFTGQSAMISPELWLPLGFLERISSALGARSERARLDDPGNRGLLLLGRLRAEVSAPEANAELATLATRLAALFPSSDGVPHTYIVAPPSRMSISDAPEDDSMLIAPTALLMAMSAIVLLIACLNLANMLLARGASRRTEMAIRQALGSGRGRLVRQLLTEGLLLAIAGGAIGLIWAYWGTQWLAASIGAAIPVYLPVVLDTSPDLTVVLTTAATCLLATLLFGLGPAWKAAGSDVLSGLKDRGGTARGAVHLRTRGRALAPRSLLIVLQLALSLVMLTAGGLFVRSAVEASDATPGFSLDSGLLVELDPSLLGYNEPQSRDVYRQVIDRLRTLPGVESAALASLVPFGEVTRMRGAQRAGAVDEEAFVPAHYYIVSDRYFESLRLPVLRGRDFTRAEASSAAGSPVAIVDEPLAERLFPGADALGRNVRLQSPGPDAEPISMQIVGVVPGTKHRFQDTSAAPHIYVPFGQRFAANMHVHLRIADRVAEPAALLETIRNEIRDVDSALPVLSLTTMRDYRDQNIFLWIARAGGRLFMALGVSALFLALVGIYGVKAFLMTRRTREIGVRMALGATRADVVRLMVRESLAVTTVGLVAGLVMALAVGRLLGSLLFEVSAMDPLVFVGATVLLAGAAMLAAYLPVRRATLIQPTVALRHE